MATRGVVSSDPPPGPSKPPIAAGAMEKFVCMIDGRELTFSGASFYFYLPIHIKNSRGTRTGRHGTGFGARPHSIRAGVFAFHGI